MNEAILHQWLMSPYCNKVRRCLAYKGVPYRVVNYNGLLARKAAGLSPAGQLPVLDWDGERLQDSTAIAVRLDERIPDRPLYPIDPRTLASARRWEDWASQSLYFLEIYFRMLDPVSMERALDLVCEGRPRWERSVLRFVFKHRYPAKLAKQGLTRQPHNVIEARFFRLLGDLDTTLSTQPWLAGEALSIADLSVASQIDELLRTSDLKPRILALENLRAWLARCDEHAPA